MNSAATAALPVTRFSTGDLEPGDRWSVWRESISVIFDTGPAPGAEDVPLAASVVGHHLGSLLIGSIHFTPQRFERSTRKIGRDGLDHYLVQFYKEGGFIGEDKAGELELRAGDICFLDLGQTVRTRTHTSRACSVIVPRQMLETILPRASNLHGTALRRESALGRLLADHLTALQRQLPALSAADAAAVADAVTGMIAACFRPTADSLNRARSPVADATLGTLKKYIDERLARPELSPESIASAFRLSRSTLYRLFEPLGGVSAYIQERRLARACAALLHPSNRTRPIYEIAFDWGFGSEVHFSRVFRRTFGLPPSEFRAIDRAAPPILPARLGEPFPTAVDYSDWIAGLARSN